MSEQPTPEPSGWLAELQRARLKGGAATATFQGLLADEIVIPQSAADARDPALVMGAVHDFADDMLERAFYLPGEFALEALMSFHAQDYLRQALQGGHGLYIADRGRDDIAIKCANACLKSMLADPHQELFERMVKLNAAPTRERRRLLKEMRARNVESAMRDLDGKLAALEAREPFAARHKIWLKSLRKVKIMPEREARQAVEALIARNPMREARGREVEQERALLMRADPAWRAAKELCDMAHLRLVRVGQGEAAPMRSVWAEGPNVRAHVWRLDTMEGPRTAVAYAEGRWFKRYLAVLIEQGVMLPRGSLALKKADIAAMAPVLLSRR